MDSYESLANTCHRLSDEKKYDALLFVINKVLLLNPTDHYFIAFEGYAMKMAGCNENRYAMGNDRLYDQT
jgi:regulator of sirC expression with transglutaminase-like and TPR domain